MVPRRIRPDGQGGQGLEAACFGVTAKWHPAAPSRNQRLPQDDVAVAVDVDDSDLVVVLESEELLLSDVLDSDLSDLPD